MKASSRAEWPNFLKPSEFPFITATGESVLDYIDSKVIDALIDLRVVANVAVIPSALWSAHVRFTGSPTSQHYAVDRLSTAVDFHCADNSQAWRIFEAAKQVPEIRGLGIYFDWSMGKVGFHIDTRNSVNRIQWVCPKQAEREYIYLNNTPERYYSEVARGFGGMH